METHHQSRLHLFFEESECGLSSPKPKFDDPNESRLRDIERQIRLRGLEMVRQKLVLVGRNLSAKEEKSILGGSLSEPAA